MINLPIFGTRALTITAKTHEFLDEQKRDVNVTCCVILFNKIH
jgi:hypothetical protein